MERPQGIEHPPGSMPPKVGHADYAAQDDSETYGVYHFQCDEQETAVQLPPDGLEPVLVDSQTLDFRIESPRW
jgi:hypothetical protein